LNPSYFISKRISRGQKEGFSSIIHTIAVITIAIGLAASIVSFLIMKGFQQTVKNKIYSFSGHLIITKFSMNNSPEEQPMNFQIDLYKRKDEMPFLKHIQEYAHKPGLVKTEDEVVGVVLKGVGKSFDVESFRENIVEGEFLRFPDSGYANQVVLSKTISNTLKASVGDDIIVHFFQNPPRFRKLKVVGIYETNLSEYFDSKIVLGDIRMIQRLNDWPDSLAGGLEVVINRDYYSRSALMRKQIDTMLDEEPYSSSSLRGIWASIYTTVSVWFSFDFDKAAIEQAREDIGTLNDYDEDIQAIHDRYLQIFEWLNLISRQVNILLAIIIIVVCVNMISVVLILVMERTQMIGMLKALGAGDKFIRSVFVYNGVNLVLKGLFFGNLAGLGFCYVQHHFKFIRLNPKDYYMSFVPIGWNWEIVIVLNVFTLLVVSLVLLLPTMVISRIQPIKAIRFD
jgi:lipoprotein-releasing system permease protein